MSKKEKVLIAALLIIAAIIVCCGNKSEASTKEYILDKGETLWEVYEEYGSGMVWGKWLYEMEKINGKGSGEAWYYGEEIIVICTK